jgi:hypothetical protein
VTVGVVEVGVCNEQWPAGFSNQQSTRQTSCARVTQPNEEFPGVEDASPYYLVPAVEGTPTGTGIASI